MTILLHSINHWCLSLKQVLNVYAFAGYLVLKTRGVDLKQTTPAAATVSGIESAKKNKQNKLGIGLLVACWQAGRLMQRFAATFVYYNNIPKYPYNVNNLLFSSHATLHDLT